MARREDSKKKKREKRKKKGAEEKSGREIFLEKVQNLMNIQKEMIMDASNDLERISEVIQDFAEPLLLLREDDKFTKKAISVAIMIWNISLLPKEKQEEALQEITSGFSKSDDPDYLTRMMSIFDILIERKKNYFTNYKKLIVDYQISGAGNNLRINVVSTKDSL